MSNTTIKEFTEILNKANSFYASTDVYKYLKEHSSIIYDFNFSQIINPVKQLQEISSQVKNGIDNIKKAEQEFYNIGEKAFEALKVILKILETFGLDPLSKGINLLGDHDLKDLLNKALQELLTSLGFITNFLSSFVTLLNNFNIYFLNLFNKDFYMPEMQLIYKKNWNDLKSELVEQTIFDTYDKNRPVFKKGEKVGSIFIIAQQKLLRPFLVLWYSLKNIFPDIIDIRGLKTAFKNTKLFDKYEPEIAVKPTTEKPKYETPTLTAIKLGNINLKTNIKLQKKIQKWVNRNVSFQYPQEETKYQKGMTLLIVTSPAFKITYNPKDKVPFYYIDKNTKDEQNRDIVVSFDLKIRTNQSSHKNSDIDYETKTFTSTLPIKKYERTNTTNATNATNTINTINTKLFYLNSYGDLYEDSSLKNSPVTKGTVDGKSLQKKSQNVNLSFIIEPDKHSEKPDYWCSNLTELVPKIPAFSKKMIGAIKKIEGNFDYRLSESLTALLNSIHLKFLSTITDVSMAVDDIYKLTVDLKDIFSQTGLHLLYNEGDGIEDLLTNIDEQIVPNYFYEDQFMGGVFLTGAQPIIYGIFSLMQIILEDNTVLVNDTKKNVDTTTSKLNDFYENFDGGKDCCALQKLYNDLIVKRDSKHSNGDYILTEDQRNEINKQIDKIVLCDSGIDCSPKEKIDSTEDLNVIYYELNKETNEIEDTITHLQEYKNNPYLTKDKKQKIKSQLDSLFVQKTIVKIYKEQLKNSVNENTLIEQQTKYIPTIKREPENLNEGTPDWQQME